MAGPDHCVLQDSVQGAGLGQHSEGSLPLSAAALLTCCKGERRKGGKASMVTRLERTRAMVP